MDGTEPANMMLRMPNCGMLVRFSPFYFINEDGTCQTWKAPTPISKSSPVRPPCSGA